MKTIRINEIENAVKHAFKKTVDDYRSNKIYLEEDCRAAFYHHMRPYIDRNRELKMLLSHNVQFRDDVIKPDVFIFRKNVYLFAIEIKCDTPQRSYQKTEGLNDRKRLKGFSGFISRGCFMHFDQKNYKYTYKRADWQNNYYIEFYHIADTNTTALYEVKQDKAKHVKI